MARLNTGTSARRKVLYLVCFSLLSVGVVVLFGCNGNEQTGPARTATSAGVITPGPAGTPTPITEPAPNSIGAMDRANPHGTGVYVTKGVLQQPRIKWKRKLSYQPGGYGNVNGRVGSTPAIVDGIVYVGGAEEYLFALDVETGDEKWKFKTPGGSVNSPAVADGVVYFSSGDQYLYAVAMGTGKELWRFTLRRADDPAHVWSAFSNPVVVGGIVYLGSARNEFLALDGKTGRVKWARWVGASVTYTPAVADGVVYFGTAKGSNIDMPERYFYALDAQTGRELWKVPQPDDVAGSPAVADGSVYIVFVDGLYALDARTGQKKWHFDKPIGVTMFSPAVAYDTVYVTSVDDRLYALDSRTGQEKWRFQRDERFFIDPIIADGLVYCITYLPPSRNGQAPSGYLYAIDAQAGQERWRLFAPGSPGDTPALEDGVIYFKVEGAEFYAVQ